MEKKDEKTPKKRVIEVPDKDILAEYEVIKKKDRYILGYLIISKKAFTIFFLPFQQSTVIAEWYRPLMRQGLHLLPPAYSKYPMPVL